MNKKIWFEKLISGFIVLLMISLFISATFTVVAQEMMKVSGTITDNKTNETIPGVTVVVKGTQTGSVTDLNGKYSINAPAGSTFAISCIGYESIDVKIGSQSEVNIKLAVSIHSIDEVVAIGYGKSTKKEITGAITTVKSEDFNKGAYNNPMGLLQGKVAGLTITNPNGSDPQAGYNILLRGMNTLTSGTGPLIVIDGVPGGDLKNISPDEVESMDVLKDGSAAAIYGTRGSNGVIIVTTRRAKKGSSKVEYIGQFSVQIAPRSVENLTADEFKNAIELYAPDKSVNIYDDDVNWFNEITRTNPLSQKHNFALSGGTENVSHRTTIYIDNAEGILKDNVSNKYLLRTNISQKVFGNFLLLDYNMSYSNRTYKPANYGLFYQSFIRNPTSPVYDPENTYSGGYTVLEGIDNYNPVAMLNERTRDGKTTEALGNIRATLNITNSLKWVNFISLEESEWEELTYRTQYYPSILGKGGEAEISNGRSNDIQFESTLNYLKSFNSHNFQLLAGYSYQEEKSNSSYMINSGFDSDFYGSNNMSAGSALGEGKAEMDSYRQKSNLISFFGRTIYNFDERYLVSASIRREGSSRFGANNKWGWFPAASIGWRINKESFMSDVNWVNDLKLRFGYGVTGNQEFDNYKSLILMGTSKKFFYNGEWINTYQPTSNPNPDLRWENKKELNAGIDFSLLKNRLSGSLDLYNRTSTDLLYTYEVSYPPYIYPLLFTNVGTIRNQGIELAINAVVVNKNSFNWATTLTFSKNNNKLVKFSNEEFTNKYIPTGWLGSSFPLYSQRLEEGKSLGTFYGPVWLGLNSDGYDLFKNANPVGRVDPEDWEPIGNAYPFCTLGWSNSLTWKNWDMNMMLRAGIGGEVLNMYRLYYENWKSLGRNIVHTQLDNPEFVGSGQYSSKYIEDATFVKLDNISLGYNVPIKSKYISNLRLNLTAQDVFTITGYKGLNPEVSMLGFETGAGETAPGIEYMSYYPRTTSVTFGVNVTF